MEYGSVEYGFSGSKRTGGRGRWGAMGKEASVMSGPGPASGCIEKNVTGGCAGMKMGGQRRPREGTRRLAACPQAFGLVRPEGRTADTANSSLPRRVGLGAAEREMEMAAIFC